MSEEYNGWTNYETWNVALWIQNDEGLYNMALECKDYPEFAAMIAEFSTKTGDGVSWNASNLSMWELNDMIEELSSE